MDYSKEELRKQLDSLYNGMGYLIDRNAQLEAENIALCRKIEEIQRKRNKNNDMLMADINKLDAEKFELQAKIDKLEKEKENLKKEFESGKAKVVDGKVFYKLNDTIKQHLSGGFLQMFDKQSENIVQ